MATPTAHGNESDNPLLQRWNTPYGLPPFGRMHSSRAYVTTGGKTGGGGSTKVLWWFRRTPAAGAMLTVSGQRIDAPGSFRAASFSSSGSSSRP